MTTALDARISKSAAAIIQKYGKAVTFTKQADGTYYPQTGAFDGNTSSDFAVKGIIESYNLIFVNGDTIRHGDRRVTVASAALPAVIPEAGDQVTVDGDVWVVVAVEGVYSGDDVAVWVVQVRR